MPDTTDDPRLAALGALLADLPDEALVVVERLVTVLAGGPREVEAVVRSRRFELVDDDGRVRAVLGDLAPSGDYSPGLALRSARGVERVSLVDHGTGPVLGLALDGEDAVLLGVDDPAFAEVVRPGPYLTLLDAAGDIALGWRVSDTGLEEHRAARDERG